MSRFRFYILPRLVLGLSVLALLGGLWVLWRSLGAPLPTAELACRRAETAYFQPHGRTVASGPVRFREAESHCDAWMVRRSGDELSVIELERTAGLLWKEVSLWSLSREDAPLYVVTADTAPIWDWEDGTDATEILPLAVCTDPAAVRVEITALWLGHWETDVQAALAGRGVSTELRHVGDQVWSGESLSVPHATPPEGTTSSSQTLYLFGRAYDADGNLLAVYDPTVD